MQLLSATAGQLPAPRPIRLIDRWRVAWHGRRDARRLPLGPDLLPPYLESLRAEAEAGQRAVSRWLHDQVMPVDREVVSLLTVLDQHRRDPGQPPPTLVIRPPTDRPEAPPPATFAIPQWVFEAREAAAELREFQRRLAERHTAEQRLSALGATRHHLIETGRAAAGAHLARYEQLTALYYAAMLRRRPDRDPAEVGYRSRSISPESWVHGDMPLLALTMDSDLPERYRWFLKEFATRTSMLGRATAPIEVPRAG